MCKGSKAIKTLGSTLAFVMAWLAAGLVMAATPELCCSENQFNNSLNQDRYLYTETPASRASSSYYQVPRQWPQINLLRKAAAQYESIAAADPFIPLPAERTINPGERYQALPALGRRLALSGDLPDSFRDESSQQKEIFYAGHYVAGVRQFQKRHGLTSDGVLGPKTFEALNVSWRQRAMQLRQGLNDWYQVTAAPEEGAIIINIPGFRLTTLAADPFTSSVIVGQAKKSRMTPEYSGEMTYLVFRPFWNIPQSILINEILPAVRRDRGYLDRERMEIVTSYSPNATPLPATEANLARLSQGKLLLRQRSGVENALGLVKFIFPNRHNIYLHDTPHHSLFFQSRRDFSHGCIRVQNAEGLARWLLRREPDWTPEAVTDAMFGAERQQIQLRAGVPVHIVYITSEVRDDGLVYFYEDIYGKQYNQRLADGTIR